MKKYILISSLILIISLSSCIIIGGEFNYAGKVSIYVKNSSSQYVDVKYTLKEITSQLTFLFNLKRDLIPPSSLSLKYT